jgi:hypothetical protein
MKEWFEYPAHGWYLVNERVGGLKVLLSSELNLKLAINYIFVRQVKTTLID